MSKVVLFAASLLLVAGIATAGIIDPCGDPGKPPVQYNGASPECYFACPQGDTDSFLLSGFWFAFEIIDVLSVPLENIPASDFWMIDCDPVLNMALCAGSASSNADSSTNAAGKTTMSLTSMSVGGCADGLSAVVQGFVLTDPTAACAPYCFNIRVRSCDQNGDLVMNLVDLTTFSGRYPPQAYHKCADFDCSGAVNLQDLTKFSFHYGPPGHKCN